MQIGGLAHGQPHPGTPKASAADHPAPSRGFWPMRDIPTAAWLVLTVVAVAVHRELPVPRWLMIHLLLLGAITHAILVWSQYFSYALLRSRATVPERRAQNLRLVLTNTGALLVLIGVPLSVTAPTLAGAAFIVAGVSWHGLSLLRRARAGMPGRFGRTIRFYIASAGLLVVGSVLGAWAVTGTAPQHLVLSHVLVNVLGWIGITVAGTVVTLWPTMLRTKADDASAAGAARALPLLAGGVLGAALGAALASVVVLALGLAAYLAGLIIIAVSLIREARRAAPRSFATLSVGAALVWWAGSVAVLLGSVAFAIPHSATDAAIVFAEIAKRIDEIVPFLVAGFAAQVLVGALSYLIPVVVGGGPGPVKVGTAGFERLGIARVTIANVSLAACLLPLPSIMLVVVTGLYVAALGSFLVVMLLAMRAQARAKRAVPPVPERASVNPASPESVPAGRRAGQSVAGLITVVLALAVTAAVSPIPVRSAAGGDTNAPVQTVRVEAADMRFTPNRIEVPAGTRLVIELMNTDATQTHDLALSTGAVSTRLAPGESTTLDAGVIEENLDGWCTIVGHKQMGMTLEIVALGSSDAEAGSAEAQGDLAEAEPEPLSSGMPDLLAPFSRGFTPVNAALPSLPDATHHEVTLTVRDTEVEVAPGVTQTLWAYNNTAPGPTLRARVGDTFDVTLINETTMGHSIDFHSSALAPDGPMRTIGPGEQLTYAFTAARAGIWMYHCSTAPMSAHIANGMYGAVVIEPAGLPSVDRSYVLVQGEYYLGDHDAGEVDPEKIARRSPDLVVFNGVAQQYVREPLVARSGERVRVWVLDAGIERPTSFHVIGGQFDTVWAEGRYLVNRVSDTGSQALGLMPAQGGFVELEFPEPGTYPFVSHFMTDAERGAQGLFEIAP